MQPRRELLEYVLCYATQEGPVSVPSDSEDVRNLASMANVCRYFAKVCRPRLYRNVVLRGPRQLQRLLELVRTDLEGPLLAYTERLYMHPGEGDFWVYRVLMALVPLMYSLGLRLPILHVLVSNTLPGLVPNRLKLPRSLPSRIYCRIDKVDLCGTKFTSGEELLRCLSVLRVSELSLLSVTCGTGVPSPPVVSRRPLWKPDIRIQAFEVGAGDMCFSTILPTTLNTWCNSFFPLHESSELDVLSELMYTVVHCCHTSASRCMSGWCIDRNSGGFQVSSTVQASVESSYRLTIALWRCGVHNPDNAELGSRYDCTISFVSRRDVKDPQVALLSPRLWKELTGTIARLRLVNKLKFEFVVSGYAEAFREEVGPVLNTLSVRGRRLEFRNLANIRFRREYSESTLPYDAYETFRRFRRGDKNSLNLQRKASRSSSGTTSALLALYTPLQLDFFSHKGSIITAIVDDVTLDDFVSFKEHTYPDISDEVKIAVAGVNRTLFHLSPAARSWEGINAALMQTHVIQPDSIHQTKVDNYVFGNNMFWKLTRNPSEHVVTAVRRWLEELIYTDESTNALLFDADEVARQLCCTEQTFGDIQSLAHHNFRREKTIMDVTALRYPVVDCLHFKVCNIRLVAWSHCVREGSSATCKNGVTGKFHRLKFKPRYEIIGQMAVSARERALREASGLFERNTKG